MESHRTYSESHWCGGGIVAENTFREKFWFSSEPQESTGRRRYNNTEVILHNDCVLNDRGPSIKFHCLVQPLTPLYYHHE